MESIIQKAAEEYTQKFLAEYRIPVATGFKEGARWMREYLEEQKRSRSRYEKYLELQGKTLDQVSVDEIRLFGDLYREFGSIK